MSPMHEVFLKTSLTDEDEMFLLLFRFYDETQQAFDDKFFLENVKLSSSLTIRILRCS